MCGSLFIGVRSKRRERVKVEISKNEAYIEGRRRTLDHLHDLLGHEVAQIGIIGQAMGKALADLPEQARLWADCEQLRGAHRNLLRGIHDMRWDFGMKDNKNSDTSELFQLVVERGEEIFQGGSTHFENISKIPFPKVEVAGENGYLFISAASEVMTNANNHSDATVLKINLSVEETTGFPELRAVIADNGSLSKGGHRQGTGLKNLRKRFQIFGGTFEISWEKGTIARFSVPTGLRSSAK
jgi:hypothetical protein